MRKWMSQRRNLCATAVQLGGVRTESEGATTNGSGRSYMIARRARAIVATCRCEGMESLNLPAALVHFLFRRAPNQAPSISVRARIGTQSDAHWTRVMPPIASFWATCHRISRANNIIMTSIKDTRY